MKTNVGAYAAGLWLSVVFGCAGARNNEGAIEHIYVTPQPASAPHDERGAAAPANAELIDLTRYDVRYLPEEAVSQLRIEPGEAVSISLLHGYLCNFSERSNSIGELIAATEALLTPGGQTPCDERGMESTDVRGVTRGEVALIAKVGEALNVNLADVNGKKGRVVYYGDDVRETGQLLNFANIPVYGPITYEGKPMYFEITVLELDNQENARVKALLGNLAGFGKQVYPPASGVLQILDSLGGALLSGDGDDREFRYQMEFDADSTLDPGERGLVLARGTYVFVRSEDRNVPFDWSNVRLDPGKGELCRKHLATAGSGWQPCNPNIGATWFTMRVSASKNATRQVVGQQFAEFESSLRDVDEKSLKDFRGAVEELGQSIVAARNYEDARRAAQQALSSQGAERDLALAGLAGSLCVTSTGGEPMLTDEQFGWLARQLKRKESKFAPITWKALKDECAKDVNGIAALALLKATLNTP